MRSDDQGASRLAELVAWLGDKLERLSRQTSDAYDRATLHALARACDPRTNPRLAHALATLDANTRKEKWMESTAQRSTTARRPRRQPARPGLRTTELWTVVGTVAASLIACLDADEPAVRIAGIVAMACLGCVLGGLYIWCRTKVKTAPPGTAG